MRPARTQSDLVGDMLARGARATPDRVLFSQGGEGGRTYGEADGRANRFANGLLAAGLVPGDRVAVWADDSVEYLETYLAAARAGLVMVPINARLTPIEARVLVGDAAPRAVLFSDRLAPAVESLFDPAELAYVGAFGSERVLGAVRTEDTIAAGRDSAPPAPDEDDLFVIAYTSGTTGVPKGAMLTHRSVKATARMNAQSYRLPIGSVGAYTGSMSFVGTVCAFAMSHLYVRGSVHLLGRWDPAAAVDLVERQRANWIYVPSPAMEDMRAELSRRPAALDALTSVFHSASKVSPEKVARLIEVVGHRYVEGWGMTEFSGGICTATTAIDSAGLGDAVDIFDSVGRPTVDAEIDVWDGEGNPLPHDGRAEGELVVRAANLMAGYWQRPEVNEKVLAGGWFRSGDIGRIDPAGYVYVSERRTDMISSGGMNVYPREVEDTILQLAGVRECAVVGVPHERWGQTVVAVIVADGAITRERVLAHCRERLAGYKKPTRVVFTGSLPRTVSDKVRRTEIREWVTAGASGATGPLGA
ncbi:MAG TPA: class I adenylate-forming enzyme family protein [Mycobacteriales bacterium]|nr:class I adenylate-forming enzyme family protein [Mycobacteriales bacterium]